MSFFNPENLFVPLVNKGCVLSYEFGFYIEEGLKMAIFSTTGRYLKAKSFYDSCFVDGDPANAIDLWFSIGCNSMDGTPSFDGGTQHGWEGISHLPSDSQSLAAGPEGWTGNWPYSNTNPPPPSVYPLATYPHNKFNYSVMSSDEVQTSRYRPDGDFSVYSRTGGLPGVIGYRRVSGVTFCRPYTLADKSKSGLSIIYYLNSYYVELTPEEAAAQNASLICLQLALNPGELADSTKDIIQIGLYKGLKKRSDSPSLDVNVALPSDIPETGSDDATQGKLLLVENTIPHKRISYNRDIRLIMLQF